MAQALGRGPEGWLAAGGDEPIIGPGTRAGAGTRCWTLVPSGSGPEVGIFFLDPGVLAICSGGDGWIDREQMLRPPGGPSKRRPGMLRSDSMNPAFNRLSEAR